MSDIAVPRTPTPGSRSGRNEGQAGDVKYSSPPILSSSELTPPPSIQPSKPQTRFESHAAPELRDRLTSSSIVVEVPNLSVIQSSWTGPLPTAIQAQELPEHRLRQLVGELLPLIGETRMHLAHAKLQYNLLSMETAEAAQRAAVEHNMTRREVEVLQAGSPILRYRAPAPPESKPADPQLLRQLDIAMTRVQELEAENRLLQHRLKQSKRVIRHVDGKNSQLVEDNHTLRQRIRENREHLNSMRHTGYPAWVGTPGSILDTPSQQTKVSEPNRRRGQDSLDALLFAGQVLSGEPSSVPSSPTVPKSVKHHISHTRGTHSLSSLPTTPNLPRPVTADGVVYTPTSQITSAPLMAFSAPPTQAVLQDPRRRDDRDSTISASDQEDAITDEDIPASQASQAASSMLRQNPGPSPESSFTASTNQERLVQSKLLGKTLKFGQGKVGYQESRHDNDGQGDDIRAIKRAKLVASSKEDLGLGIGLWASPGK